MSINFLKFFLFVSILFNTISAVSQEVKVIKFPALENIINQNNGKTKVINFWATWCKPCVSELPQFEALLAKYGPDKVDVILVSFDFVEELQKKVIPFINKKKLQSRVVLLDETDYNAFIDKIDSSWSGAIPATLIIDYRKDKRTFFEKEFKEGELEKSYLSVTTN